MPDLLRAKKVTKGFAGGVTLSEVNFEVSTGEVVALIGRNGAGRKTLLRLLAGTERVDEGELTWQGEVVSWSSEAEAQAAGVVLMPRMAEAGDRRTVADWVWEGREPKRWGFLKKRGLMCEATTTLLESWELEMEATDRVGDLSREQRQWVALIKAVAMQPKLLLMDDPMLWWPEDEMQRLAVALEDVKKRGMGVVLVTGSFSGLSAVADRAVVLRAGRNAGQVFKYELEDEEEMLRLIGGAEAPVEYERQLRKKGWVVVDVQGLRTRSHAERVFGFDLSQGEIVGLAGFEGSGRREVLEVLCGLETPGKGDILIGGDKQRLRSVNDAMAAGLAMVPEDGARREKFLKAARGLKRGGDRGVWLQGSMGKKDLDRLAELLCTKGETGEKEAVQKWQDALAYWLSLGPGVLLLEEPTRGMDVLTKWETYQLIERLAQRGMAVLLVSSDLDELTVFPDRVLVMHEGDLMGVLQGERIKKEAILQLAAGGQRGLPVKRGR